MTLLTLVLIVVIILAVIGLGWQTFVIAVLDGFDRALDVSIPIIKNLTQQQEAQEAHAAVELLSTNIDPNPIIQQLGAGGFCVFDDNLKALEEELNTYFTKAMEDELRLQTEKAFDKAVNVSQGQFVVTKDC
jgi:hypothetical protein